MIELLIYISGIIASISISAFYNRKHIKKNGYGIDISLYLILSLLSWIFFASMCIMYTIDFITVDNKTIRRIFEGKQDK